MQKYRSLVYRSEQRGWKVGVSPRDLEYLLETQNFRCALSGRLIGFGDAPDGSDTASPDRIDSNSTYTQGNVEWSHKEFNKLKRDFTNSDFVAMCTEVADYHRGLAEQEKISRALEPSGTPGYMVCQMFGDNFVADEGSTLMAEFAPGRMYDEKVAHEVYEDLQRNLNVQVPMPSRQQQREIVRLIQQDETLDGSVDVYFTLLCYARSKGKPITRSLRVGREFAHFLLDTEINKDNRRLSKHMLGIFTQDLTDGHWDHNGETMIIAETGQTNDGQHRLEICVQTGIPIVTEFCVGVSRESRFNVDKGKKRTAGDSAGMRGYKDGNNLMAVANVILTYVYDRSNIGQKKWSETKRREFVDRHMPSIYEHTSSVRYCYKALHNTTKVSILWAMRFLFAQKDPADAEYFFDRIRDGDCRTGDRSSAILRLRNQLVAVKDSRKQFMNQDAHTIVWIIKAWNDFRQGRIVPISSNDGKALSYRWQTNENVPTII